MELRVTEHRVRLGRAEFRVLRPAAPLARTLVVGREWSVEVLVGGADAAAVAALWLLAARSPRSLVHLPVRATTPPVGGLWPGDLPLDLVLSHRGLQFSPSGWKDVRAGLGRGRLRTAELPEVAALAPVDHDAYAHVPDRERLHERVHADTLFVTGDAPLFREVARLHLDVAANGGHHGTHEHLGVEHYCQEVHPNANVLGRGARRLHLVHTAHWTSTGRRGEGPPRGREV
ncbi:hypothetical protein [Actinosynnema pretiosum]|uniref:Uncharacterized protein n=1 Tax=Actinosynnema pretiosum TaxID=42197 RepID=A0A290ZAC2_9PSEU|nr:hypothetical protein [Actinosynnema pretiosum]ATE55980.1 hypothetical protein CNX65_24120 [Actinosynnema pretiosum]